MSEDSSPDWVPAACTLPTAEKPLRRAEFDDLFRTTVAVELISDVRARFVVSGPATRVDAVRDLTARENDCCSFFDFTVVAQPPDRIMVDIEVPTGHRHVLDGLLRRAAEVRRSCRTGPGAAGS